MMKQQQITKECSNCRQSKYSFKKGICKKWGEQIWFVNCILNPKQYVKSDNPEKTKVDIDLNIKYQIYLTVLKLFRYGSCNTIANNKRNSKYVY